MSAKLKLISIFFLLNYSLSAISRPPQLTDEQKKCIDNQVGAEDRTTKPSREEMELAMNTCGIEKPQQGNQNHPRSRNEHKNNGPELSSDQKACIENLIGKPGEKQDLSRELIESAFNSCGVSKPIGPEQNQTQENSNDAGSAVK